MSFKQRIKKTPTVGQVVTAAAGLVSEDENWDEMHDTTDWYQRDVTVPEKLP